METRTQPARIVLMGKTGQGKSTLGNQIMGKGEIFKVGHSIFYKTSWVIAQEFAWPYNQNTQVTLVDTPCLADNRRLKEELSDDKIREMIEEFMKTLDQGLNIGLFCWEAKSRFSADDLNELALIQELLGKGVIKYVWICITQLDKFTEDEAEKAKTNALNDLPKILKDNEIEFDTNHFLFPQKKDFNENMMKRLDEILLKENVYKPTVVQQPTSVYLQFMIDKLEQEAKELQRTLKETKNEAKKKLITRQLSQTEMTLSEYKQSLERKRTIQTQARIVLMGKTGQGKSTLGNQIMGGGEKFEVGHSIFSKTSEVIAQEFAWPYNQNTQVTLVDTPGLADNRRLKEELSDDKILKMIEEFMKKLGQGLNVGLFCWEAKSRFSADDLDELTLIQELLGKGVIKYLWICITQLDKFTKDDAEKAKTNALNDLPKILKDNEIEFDANHLLFPQKKDFNENMMKRLDEILLKENVYQPPVVQEPNSVYLQFMIDKLEQEAKELQQTLKETKNEHLKKKKTLDLNKTERTISKYKQKELDAYEFHRKVTAIPTSNLDCLKLACKRTIQTTHEDGIYDVVFLEEDQRIVTSSGDFTIMVHDFITGNHLHTLTGHTDRIWKLIKLQKNGLLASCSSDKTIRVWNIQKLTCERVLQGHTQEVWTLIELPSLLMLSGSRDKSLKLWDLKLQTNECCVRTIQNASLGYIETGILLNKNELAYGSEENIHVINFFDGTWKKTLTGHEGWVRNLNLLANGNTLLSGSDDCSIRMWNLAEGKCLKIFKGHTYGVSKILLWNANTIVSASDDDSIKFWNLDDGKCLNTLTGHEYGTDFITIRPDGTLISCGGDDKTIRIWDATSF